MQCFSGAKLFAFNRMEGLILRLLQGDLFDTLATIFFISCYAILVSRKQGGVWTKKDGLKKP